ncbi:MAG: hypothetical protein JZU59_04120, partial [Chromatium okenii]|nr:hypothetical protein [Chromatium okenii]
MNISADVHMMPSIALQASPASMWLQIFGSTFSELGATTLPEGTDFTATFETRLKDALADADTDPAQIAALSGHDVITQAIVSNQNLVPVAPAPPVPNSDIETPEVAPVTTAAVYAAEDAPDLDIPDDLLKRLLESSSLETWSVPKDLPDIPVLSAPSEKSTTAELPAAQSITNLANQLAKIARENSETIQLKNIEPPAETKPIVQFQHESVKPAPTLTRQAIETELETVAPIVETKPIIQSQLEPIESAAAPIKPVVQSAPETITETVKSVVQFQSKPVKPVSMPFQPVIETELEKVAPVVETKPIVQSQPEPIESAAAPIKPVVQSAPEAIETEPVQPVIQSEPIKPAPTPIQPVIETELENVAPVIETKPIIQSQPEPIENAAAPIKPVVQSAPEAIETEPVQPVIQSEPIKPAPTPIQPVIET